MAKESSQEVAGLAEKIESTEDFVRWRKENNKAFLASVFVMAKKTDDLGEAAFSGSANEWLLSYYDEASDTFTTFSSITGPKAEKEEAFKKGKSLPRLDLGKVKVEFRDGLKEAEKLRLGKYKGEAASSVIIVLQPLTPGEIAGKAGSRQKGGAEVVWNITYITSAFNVMNVKVSAESGNVLHDSLSGIMDFMKKDK